MERKLITVSTTSTYHCQHCRHFLLSALQAPELAAVATEANPYRVQSTIIVGILLATSELSTMDSMASTKL
eukprot:1160797-Pelagomonas_calceolata.AAC.1